MKTKIIITIMLSSFILMSMQSKKEDKMKTKENSKTPFVDYDAFENLVKEVQKHREERLINFDEFMSKSAEPNTIILDTRSKEMYDLKHIKGAIHLNFSDFTQFSLDAIMNDYAGKSTQILIYCNNNFTDLGNVAILDQISIINTDPAFITKAVIPMELSSIQITDQPEPLTLALNIPTYLNLYGYGYTNVFELNELVDVKDSRVEFEGSFDDNLN